MVIDNANFIQAQSTNIWSGAYIPTPITLANPYNAVEVIGTGQILAGTFNTVSNPSAKAYKLIDQGFDCGPAGSNGISNSICINVGGNPKPVNVVTSIYTYENWSYTPSNITGNIINVLKATNANPFGLSALIDNIQCTLGRCLPPWYPIVGNYITQPYYKAIYINNLSNITGAVKIAKAANFSSRGIIIYDGENGSADLLGYEQWYLSFSIESACNYVHSQGLLFGYSIVGDTPFDVPDNGRFSPGQYYPTIDYSCLDYASPEVQYYMGNGGGQGGGAVMSQVANAIISNVTGTNLLVKFPNTVIPITVQQTLV